MSTKLRGDFLDEARQNLEGAREGFNEAKRGFEWAAKRLAEATAVVERARADADEFCRKVELLRFQGWEARTGHKTSSSTHREWQSDSGEPFTWLVVRQGTPQITHVHEWSSGGPSFDVKDGKEEDIEVYHGETEVKAWRAAIDEEFYSSD